MLAEGEEDHLPRSVRRPRARRRPHRPADPGGPRLARGLRPEWTGVHDLLLPAAVREEEPRDPRRGPGADRLFEGLPASICLEAVVGPRPSSWGSWESPSPLPWR